MTEEKKLPQVTAETLLNDDAEVLNKALAGNWMRVKCTIGRWDDKIRNELITEEVKKNHGIDGKHVGDFYTRLFADARSELDDLNSKLSAVRTAAYAVTKKVEHNFYIAPVADMPNVIKTLSGKKKDADEAAKVLRAVFPHRVAQAQAQLKGTISGLHYPSVEDVLSRVYVDLSFEPMPDMRTFKGMSLPAEVTATFAAQVANRQTKLVSEMVENLYGDLVETTTDLATYFGRKAKGEKGGKLFDSKIEKIKRLAKQLESASGIVNTDFSALSDAVNKLADSDFDAAKASITAARGVRDMAHGISKNLRGLANMSPATVAAPPAPPKATPNITTREAIVKTVAEMSVTEAEELAEALQPAQPAQPAVVAPPAPPKPVQPAADDPFAGLNDMFF
jgi:hypothetical protein